MKIKLMILVAAMMLGGCQQKKTEQQVLFQTVEQEDSTVSTYFVNDEGELELTPPLSGTPVAILDSLLTFQSIDASPAKKALHEWKWAKQTRKALGQDETIDLEYLDAVSFEVDSIYDPLTAYSQAEMNQAAGMFASTACFRLLNAYRKLADEFEESLDESLFLQDYTLWEGVYREYAEKYTDGGSSGPMVLNYTYKTLAELRRSMLTEEIGYLGVEHFDAAKWFVEVNEINIKPYQKAILLWYDHRMKMADKLQEINKNRAEYLRRMTYKTIFIYTHLQLDFWQYDFENK